MFSPGAPARISWSADCEQLCLMVPSARLELAFEQLVGRSPRGPLTFEFAADLQSLLGRRWRTMLDLLVDELDSPTDVTGNPQAGRHLEALVLDGLLLSQVHSHHRSTIGSGSAGARSAIRRAVDLMEGDPSAPWTTMRLAAEVHVSPRALQAGFRRDFATTPMTYLRRARLLRARQALEAADRDATTVRAVAVSLGILHLGRFAAAYRDAFGETPSDTLASGSRPSGSADRTTQPGGRRSR